MTTNRVQAFRLQQLGGSAPVRRRFVPPSLPEPVSQSQNQRWRERPWCPALPVAPARRDGVVHASVGRVPYRCHACSARAGRTRRPRAHDRVRVRWDKAVRDAIANWVRSRGSLSRRNVAFIQSDIAPGTIASLMLAPCSALSMLFASLRPGRRAGPAGIDDASAQHVSGSYAMVVRVMVSRMALTRESRRSMLASSRAARHILRSPQRPTERASGRRPQGTASSALLSLRRSRTCTLVSCKHRDLSLCIVLRTVRRQRRRSPGSSFLARLNA